MRYEVCSWQARLRGPFVSSYGRSDVLTRVGVTLADREGHVGRGETTVLPAYAGVEAGQVRAALEDCRPALEGGRPEDRAELVAECGSRAVLPQALAAIDLALWDLAGQRAGRPLWRLLGAGSAGPVPVNATIAAEDRASAAEQASQARAAGFRCVKVKVGIGDDAGRVAAVRAAAGPAMQIRLDANGAWAVEEALANLRALAPAAIECCEEPVSGLAELAAVSARSPVAIALDESAALPGALHRRVAQAVCLKLARCGGVTGVLQAARQARAAGYEVYLSSTLEGPRGIAAALHAAAALRPERPCGLATLALTEDEDPLPPVDGAMYAPGEAGIGL